VAVCAGENGRLLFPYWFLYLTVAFKVGKIVDGQIALLLAAV
jgi:hypothetical protein